MTRSFSWRGSPWSADAFDVPAAFFLRWPLWVLWGLVSSYTQTALPPTTDTSPEGDDFRDEADAVQWIRGFTQSWQPQGALRRDWPFTDAVNVRNRNSVESQKEDGLGKPR